MYQVIGFIETSIGVERVMGIHEHRQFALDFASVNADRTGFRHIVRARRSGRWVTIWDSQS